MDAQTEEQVRGALDFVQSGFDVVTDLALSTTLEVTTLSYSALRAAGVWSVVLKPVESAQKGATVLIFRCVRLGGRVVIGAASIGARLVG